MYACMCVCVCDVRNASEACRVCLRCRQQQYVWQWQPVCSHVAGAVTAAATAGVSMYGCGSHWLCVHVRMCMLSVAVCVAMWWSS